MTTSDATKNLRNVARLTLRHPRALEGMYVAIQAFGVVASLVIARSLGPDGRGSITILVVWSQLLGWISAFSLDKAIVVLSRSKDAQLIDPNEALGWSRRIVLILSGPVSIAALAIGLAFFHKWSWAAILAIGALATAYGELGAGWLLAKQQISKFILYKLGQPILYITGCISVALILRHSAFSLRLDTMAIAVLVSLVAPVVVVTWGVRPKYERRISGGRLFRFAASTQAANAMQYLNSRLDIVALSIFSSPKEVGIYSIGLATGQVTVLIGSAGIVRGITGTAQKLDRSGVLGTALLGFAICALSPIVIPFFFGHEFVAAIRVSQIIALGGSVNFALQSSSGRLLGSGRPWMMALAEGCGAVTFGIGVAISRNLDVIAISDVASYIVSLVVAQICLRRIDGERQSFAGGLPVVPE